MRKHDRSVTRSVDMGENNSAILGRKGNPILRCRDLRKEQGWKDSNEGTHRITLPLLWPIVSKVLVNALTGEVGSAEIHLSDNPTYHELSVADTKICTTFAQLWQTPALTGKIDPGDRR